MSASTVFLSLRGRLARAAFFRAMVLLLAAFVALYLVLDALLSEPATLILYPPVYWALLALLVKRLHDRGRSALWLLLLLVPIAGQGWFLVEVFLLPGTAGENRYGADPLRPEGDYLEVR